MKSRLIDCGRSFRSLPLWVQIWVALFLVPVNAAPFLLFDTDVGRIGMISTLLILLTNVPIMLVERGMSRLMSVPHLLIWTPLIVLLVLHLQYAAALTSAERALAWALIALNGTSLGFDVLDSWRWWRGERDVPGHLLGERA
ncbi:MAG: hypothetical protein HYV17_11300 [Xanthomonadales bacterium]|nr:hypothetical protein [Xanthomonadales bacterium]